MKRPEKPWNENARYVTVQIQPWGLLRFVSGPPAQKKEDTDQVVPVTPSFRRRNITVVNRGRVESISGVEERTIAGSRTDDRRRREGYMFVEEFDSCMRHIAIVNGRMRCKADVDCFPWSSAGRDTPARVVGKKGPNCPSRRTAANSSAS